MKKQFHLFSSFLLIIIGFNAQARIYGGIGLGSDFLRYKQSAHIVQPLLFDARDTTRHSGTGVFGSLFLGINKVQNRLYIAGEINGNLSSEKFRATNSEAFHGSFATTTYKMNNTIAISALPGYLLTPDTVIYGRVGFANSHFQSITTDTTLSNVNQRVNGFRYGLGASRLLCGPWALRIDYSLTNYRRIHFSTFDAPNNVLKTTEINPIQQLIEFGVVYHIS